MLLRFVPLEQRLLFDAAIAAVIADAVTTSADSHAEAPPPAASQGQDSKDSSLLPSDKSTTSAAAAPVTDSPSVDAHAAAVRVMVVSSQIPQLQDFISAISSDVIVVAYQQDGSSLEDISKGIERALNGRIADSIAFAGHGQDGEFVLTSEITVTKDTLSSNTALQQFWKDIGGMIHNEGRVDFLSCDFSKTDSEALTQIDSLLDDPITGREVSVAASDDMTGNPVAGANWFLEYGGISTDLLYFNANRLASWDGILDGLININASGNSSPSNFTQLGSFVYFAADGGAAVGRELYRTDGTTATLVKDINLVVGGGSSNPDNFIVFNGNLYFTARGVTSLGVDSGIELWKSDGTSAGTVMVADLNPGAGDTLFDDFMVVNNKLYFTAFPGGTRGLYSTDGTTVSANLTPTLTLGGGGTNLNAAILGTDIYFRAGTGATGIELYIYHTANNQLQATPQITPGANGSFPLHLTAFNSRVYFYATADSANVAFEMYVYNPATNTSSMFFDAGVGALGNSNGPMMTKPVISGGLMYFTSNFQSQGNAVNSLVRTDGTAAGTYSIMELPNAATNTISQVTAVGDVVFFSADRGNAMFNYEADTYLRELYKTTGSTYKDTTVVKNINATGASDPTSLVAYQNAQIYFAANDGTSGNELWVSDGTAAGTVRFQDINAGGPPSNPTNLTIIGNKIYLSATGGSGTELYVYTLGSATSTAPVATNLVVSTGENTTLVRNAANGLLVGVTDADGDTSFAPHLVAGPTHGNVAIGLDGSWSYTPDTGYIGADSFTYKVDDGVLLSTAKTVSISVVDRTAPVGGTLVYSQDFSAASSASSLTYTANPFTNSIQFNPTPQVIFGQAPGDTNARFLGLMGNQSATWTVNGLGSHDLLLVSYDLITVGSWDGIGITSNANSQVGTFGPDAHYFYMNGVPVLDTTISSSTYFQAFPDNFPASFAARTGAFAVGTLGYNNTGTPEVTYRITYLIEHTGASATFSAQSDLTSTTPNSPATEESWGMDNISVTAYSLADLSVAATHVGGLNEGTSNGQFMVTLTNSGPSTATGVVIKVTSGLQNLQVSSFPAGVTFNSLTGEISVSSITTGTVLQMVLSGTVPSTSTFSSVAEITASNQWDPDSVPNGGAATEDDRASAIAIVNRGPIANADSYTALEDNVTLSIAPGVRANDLDPEGNSFTAVFDSQQAVPIGSIFFQSNGSFLYSPNSNAFGTDSFTYHLVDSLGAIGAPTTVTITVLSVNDAPTITLGSALSVSEDSASHGHFGYATGITVGPANEAGQFLSVSLTPSDSSFFTSGGQPAIDLNTGNLTYTLAPNKFGTVNVSVTLTDSGGTANGGVNSFTTSFDIVVNNVNDAPTFTLGSNQQVAEDSGVQSIANFLTNASPGPFETEAISISVSNDNNGLFSSQPTINLATGLLTYTSALNQSGVANVTVTVFEDADQNGVLDPGGLSTSQTFTITVDPVNDVPMVNDATFSVTENASIGGGVGNVVASDVEPGSVTYSIISGNTGNAFGIDSNGLIFINGTINYEAFSQYNLVVQVTDGGGLTNTAAVTINVIDLPSISGRVFEDLDSDGAIAGSISYRSGVLVRLYQDSGSVVGAPDATDAFVASTTTDVNGLFSFERAAGNYWITIDSTTLTPSVGNQNGSPVPWAEQTFGPSGSVKFDGSAYTFTSSAGTLYGGKQVSVSDDANTLLGAEHAARVILSSSITTLDFGFSYEVIVNTNGGALERHLQGSLRQFLSNSNKLNGVQTSQFHIGAVGSSQTINVTGILFSSITDQINLNAFTQGGAGYSGSPLIRIDGVTLTGATIGLSLNSSAAGSVIEGFSITNFTNNEISVSGANSIIRHNYLGVALDGITAATNHTLSSAYAVTNSANNVIIENNVISGGIRTSGGMNNTIIRNNYVGVQVGGNAALLGSAPWNGILSTALGTQVLNNVIGNINGPAITIIGTGATIYGNHIGVGEDGVTAISNLSGIDISGANSTVGSATDPSKANIIANSTNGPGVLISSGSVTGISIRGNSIYNNSGLGIDLSPSGVAINDLGDTDSGANSLQNYPVITSVVPSSGNITVSGTLNSTSSATFNIDIYASTTADPSGFGEGQVYLGSTTVTTDSSGNGSFNFVHVDVGKLYITATATNITGSTSEFSAARRINSPPVAIADAYSVNEDQAITNAVSVKGNDTDSDDPINGATISLVGPGPTHASLFVLNADGTFDYTPEANYYGTDTFTYRLNDGLDSGNTATVTITVNAVNDSPTFDLGANQNVNEDSGVHSVANFLANASPGPFETEALSITVSNNNNTLFSSQPTINLATGLLTYTSAANQFGVATVTVTVFEDADQNGVLDPGGLSTSHTFTITVDPINDAPIVNDVTVSVTENTSVGSGLVNVSATDVEPGALTYSIISGNIDNAFAIDSNGLVYVSGAIDYETVSQYNLVVQVTDSGGLIDTGTVTVNVIDLATISGHVFEDLEADGSPSGSISYRPGVTVRLYQDNGSGSPDATDPFVSSTTTDVNGLFSFERAAGTYWITVNSLSITPSEGLTLVPGQPLAEQTHGPIGSVTFNGSAYTFSAAAGELFGGKQANVADNNATLLGSEHVAKVVLAAQSITQLDFGFSFSAIVNANPASQGSFRQFIVNSNRISGVQTSYFHIGTVGSTQILNVGSHFESLIDQVHITGLTQGGVGYSGPLLIRIDGAGIGGNAFGILVTGSNGAGSIIEGLSITNFNYAGIAINSTNVTVRNNYVGVGLDGVTAMTNQTDLNAYSIRSSSSNSLIQGNIVSGGISVESSSPNSIVRNNYVGVQVGGNAALLGPTSSKGIIASASLTQVLDNVIGNINGPALTISAGGNLVYGNHIGVGADGVTVIANASGILVNSANTTIGSATISSRANIIANSTNGPGVFISSGTISGISIRGNSIYNNSGLGIDLNPIGVAVNDTGDSDSGANGLQNYPIITSAIPSGGNVTVSGTLNSTANATFNVDIYASTAADPSGFGEGQVYVGSTTVTTNGSGNGAFSLVYVDVGKLYITATATNSTGSTSEFSAARRINSPPVAIADSYSVNEDQTINAASVKGNDTDSDDSINGATVSLVGPGPTHASLFVLNADGTFDYTPEANYYGTDTFTYRLNDGLDSGNVATVSITVNSVNDVPVANADTYSGAEDTNITGNVITNDTDVEGPLFATVTTGPTHGALVFNSDGSFTYTPDANYFGPDSFTYSLSDGVASSTALVSLDITPVNDVPVANA
ncbi:MAG: Ig-like domain-containing protein, partial [Chlamydiales bacterium]|nr:Ig-like domain-containing protein [Chlamydiales bacterium]